MKKILFIFALIFCALAHANINDSWNIDKFMRFNIAYLPDNTLNLADTKSQIQPPLLQPDYAFDVNNINLANFLNLGFDVPNPESANDYNFYIKFYKFPTNLNSKNIINDFLANFRMDLSPSAKEISQYINNKNNLIIKKCMEAKSNEKFTFNNPIPKFAYANNKYFNNYFANHVPFYTLYLLPTTKITNNTLDEQIKNSSDGVKTFYNEILPAYKKNLPQLPGADNRYYYFLAKKNAHKITIIKLPQEILFFKNWRDLPMPQDPKRIFVTSLLLIYSTDYSLKNINTTIPQTIPTIDADEFNNLFTKNKTKVFEVSSIVHLKIPI